jgi:hypothetical protein
MLKLSSEVSLEAAFDVSSVRRAMALEVDDFRASPIVEECQPEVIPGRDLGDIRSESTLASVGIRSRVFSKSAETMLSPEDDEAKFVPMMRQPGIR